MALGERLRGPAQKYFFELTLSDYAAPQISVMRKAVGGRRMVSNDDYGLLLVTQSHGHLRSLSRRRHSVSACSRKTLYSHEWVQKQLDVFAKDLVPLESLRDGRRLWWLTTDDLPYLKNFLSESSNSEEHPPPTMESVSAEKKNVKLFDTIGNGALPLQGMSDRFTRAISCGGFHTVALVAAEWIKDSNGRG